MAVTHNALHRFVQGVTDNRASHPLGIMTLQDPTNWGVFFDDFLGNTLLTTVPNGTAAVQGDYTVVAGVTEDTLISYASTGTGMLGVVTFTSEAGAEAENTYVDTADNVFALEVGVPWVLEARYATQSANVAGGEATFIGLHATGGDETTMFAADALTLAAVSAVGFVTFDSSTDIDCVAVNSSAVTQATGVGTSGGTSQTFNTMTMAYDGNTVRSWANGALSSTTMGSTAFPTADMTIAIHVEDGASEAFDVTTLAIDYVLFAMRTDRDNVL